MKNTKSVLVISIGTILYALLIIVGIFFQRKFNFSPNECAALVFAYFIILIGIIVSLIVISEDKK